MSKNIDAAPPSFQPGRSGTLSLAAPAAQSYLLEHIMMSDRGSWRLAACLACLLWLTGCGGDSSNGGGGSITQPTPAWQLQGTVSEAGTNKRLSAVRVEVVDGANAGKSTSTDGNGTFRISGLTQGGFSVKASAAGHDSVTQGVTLTSDQTVDFSLPMAAPVLFAQFEPATITVTASGDAEYPYELDFTLLVQESNYVDVWVETIQFRLMPPAGEAIYWECESEWLRQYYFPLKVGGGSTKIFRMSLIYDDPIAAGTLTARVEVKDSLGGVFGVFGNAKVQSAAAGRMTGLVGPPAGAPARLAPKPR